MPNPLPLSSVVSNGLFSSDNGRRLSGDSGIINDPLGAFSYQYDDVPIDSPNGNPGGAPEPVNAGLPQTSVGVDTVALRCLAACYQNGYVWTVYTQKGDKGNSVVHWVQILPRTRASGGTVLVADDGQNYYGFDSQVDGVPAPAGVPRGSGVAFDRARRVLVWSGTDEAQRTLVTREIRFIDAPTIVQDPGPVAVEVGQSVQLQSPKTARSSRFAPRRVPGVRGRTVWCRKRR